MLTPTLRTILERAASDAEYPSTFDWTFNDPERFGQVIFRYI